MNWLISVGGILLVKWTFCAKTWLKQFTLQAFRTQVITFFLYATEITHQVGVRNRFKSLSSFMQLCGMMFESFWDAWIFKKKIIHQFFYMFATGFYTSVFFKLLLQYQFFIYQFQRTTSPDFRFSSCFFLPFRSQLLFFWQRLSFHQSVKICKFSREPSPCVINPYFLPMFTWIIPESRLRESASKSQGFVGVLKYLSLRYYKYYYIDPL